MTTPHRSPDTSLLACARRLLADALADFRSGVARCAARRTRRARDHGIDDRQRRSRHRADVFTTDNVSVQQYTDWKRGAEVSALSRRRGKRPPVSDHGGLGVAGLCDGQAGLQGFHSISRIEARRKNASPLRLRFSQSLASLRQRLSQAIVRSTVQRFGNTTNPST
jgi:hypothetical protein